MMDSELTLTLDERLTVVKEIWPEECRLMGDDYLTTIASEQYILTTPEGGLPMDPEALIKLLTAAFTLVGVAIPIIKRLFHDRSMDAQSIIANLERQGALPPELNREVVERIVVSVLRILQSKSNADRD